jgi:hypothetical protein
MITANSQGVAEGSMTVPAGVPAGKVLVRVVGDQGSVGTTTYTASGTITTQSRRIVTTVVTRYDPLAQTFTLTEGRHIAASVTLDPFSLAETDSTLQAYRAYTEVWSEAENACAASTSRDNSWFPKSKCRCPRIRLSC